MDIPYTYSFWGMHFAWWLLWILLLIWIFVVSYDIPGQRKTKDSASDILKKRLASGEISIEEYQTTKSILEKI